LPRGQNTGRVYTPPPPPGARGGGGPPAAGGGAPRGPPPPRRDACRVPFPMLCIPQDNGGAPAATKPVVPQNE
ncbi:hypothetical protein C6Q13_27470, partial [Burkholderia gladioli]